MEFKLETEIKEVKKAKKKNLVLTDSQRNEYDFSDIYYPVKEVYQESGLNLSKLAVTSSPKGIEAKDSGKTSARNNWKEVDRYTQLIGFANGFLSKANNKNGLNFLTSLANLNSSGVNIAIEDVATFSPVVNIGMTEAKARTNYGNYVQIKVFRTNDQSGFVKMVNKPNTNQLLGICLAGDMAISLKSICLQSMLKNQPLKDLQDYLTVTTGFYAE